MDEILTEVRALADILVIDAPPFGLADASVLASKADGVIVVVRPGYTSRNGARAMQAQLERAGASVLGMVLNRASRSHVESLGGYGDYLRDLGGGDQEEKGAGTPSQGGAESGKGAGGPWLAEAVPSSDTPSR
jgi:Mrp family chromosome partitioning ATPase